jgi:hypothetical protein
MIPRNPPGSLTLATPLSNPPGPLPLATPLNKGGRGGLIFNSLCKEDHGLH